MIHFAAAKIRLLASKLYRATPKFIINSLIATLSAIPSTILSAQTPSPDRAASLLASQPLRFEPTTEGRMVSRSAGRILQIGKGGTVGLSASGQSPVAMYLGGADPNAAPIGESQLPGHSNYFLGNDPTKYRTHVNQYSRARLNDIYRNIDLVYYGNDDRLEYDYMVAPQADPDQIRMSFQGAQPTLDPKTGSLILKTADHRTLELRQPVAYQRRDDGSHAVVAAMYHALPDHQFAFSLGPYDHARPLIIDPVITYSTYFGGSNLDGIVDMRVDKAGNMYLLMQTDSTDLPQLGGPGSVCGTGCGSKNPDPPFAQNPGSKYDFYVAALDSTGTTLKFATYIGGSDRDIATSLAYDPAGYLYIAGGSLSTDFPTLNGYSTQPPKNGSGTVILGGTLTKITADGSYLLYSTFFGNGPLSLGSPVQDIGTVSTGNADGLAASYNGVVYMIGYAGGGTLPTKNPLFKEGNDFVAKFDTSKSGVNSLLFSTLVGDDQNPANGPSLSSIALDSVANLWLYGETHSNTFPVTSASSLQPACAIASCNTSFLMQLNADDTAVSYATYLGGSVNSFGASAGNLPQDLIVDASDNLYVTGITNQVDYPLKNQAYGYSDLAAYGTTLGYITKVTAGGQAIAYSTLFSGETNTLAATSSGQVAVAISAGSGYPTKSTLTTPALSGANRDAVFLTFDTTASGNASLLVSSYLGSSTGTTTPVRVAYDANNLLYISGYTTASDYPTDSPYQLACNSCSGANVAPEGFLTRVQPAPGFGASPSSITFPDIPVGQQSGTMAATLSNPTTKGIYLSAPKLSDAADFTTSNNCNGFLQPGLNCTITFTFTPQSSGQITATLSIADLDNQQNPVVIALSGQGTSTQTSLSLSPTTLNFGSLSVGATSTMTIALQNSSASAVPIQGATVSGTGFTLSSDGCGASIAASSTCQYGITAAPAVTGQLSGSLTVASGTPNVTAVHPFVITNRSAQLTAIATGGTGTETLTPASVNFGNVYLSSVGTQVVTFTNNGSQPVTISGTTIMPSDFKVVGTTCGTQVAAKGSCTYTLTFQSIAYITQVGTFTVQDGSSNPSVALTATGVQDPTGAVTLLPNSLIFSDQVAGAPSSTQRLNITNSSTASIQILSTDISAVNTNASSFSIIPLTAGCLSPGGCTYSIASGTGVITYTIVPGGGLVLLASMTGTGPVDQTLVASAQVYWTLVGDPTPQPVRHVLLTALTGNLITPAAPSVSPTSISFPVTANGKTSAAQVVTVGNSGDQALGFGGVTFAGANPGSFTQTNNCPASLTKGMQCTINVLFAPGATGQDFTATMNVSLTTPSGDASAVVALTGYTSNSDFTFTSNSGDMYIGSGNGDSSTYTFQIAPIDPSVGFNSPITFSIAGLQGNTASYTFSPSTVTPGKSTVTVKLNFGSPSVALQIRHRRMGDKALPFLACGVFSLLMWRKRLRMRPRFLSLILFALLSAGLLSTAGCTLDYDFVVTATSGSISHSVQLEGWIHQ